MRRNSRRRAGFTIVEMLTTVAVLIIVLGLMVSLARHVRAASAEQSTRDILHQLDEAMAIYIQRNDGQLPDVPLLLSDNINVPAENELKLAALRNNQAFVRALNNAGLLAGRFDDLSIAYFDETQVRDAWGTPIVFMPHMHPAVGMNPRGWFFFSAGPDRQFLTREDNLYSYEQPAEQQ
ncbi:MAG: type II secretion system protein [Tepidisphaeraceae bacterium]|jgi:type II secretory pathway pseudopilin PulG